MDSRDIPTSPQPGQPVQAPPPLIELNATSVQFREGIGADGNHVTAIELSADNLVSAKILLTDDGVQQIIARLTAMQEAAASAGAKIHIPEKGLIGPDGRKL